MWVDWFAMSHLSYRLGVALGVEKLLESAKRLASPVMQRVILDTVRW